MIAKTEQRMRRGETEVIRCIGPILDRAMKVGLKERKVMKNEKRSSIVLECPICNEKHEFEEQIRLDKTIIKGVIVEYEEVYFACNKYDEENEFVNGKMMNANLLRARNEYRRKMGLLTSDEIVAIREKYGLSQVDLSNLLGWGEVTISRYESKAIQDEPYDNILREIRDNPLRAFSYLEKNKEKLGDKYSEIKSRVLKCIDAYDLSRQALEDEYVRYESMEEYNGNQRLDVDKLENMINFFASKMKGLYKVKLMKLLWYADSLNYKLHQCSMSGLVYTHYTMGALPKGHHKILGLKNINVKEEYESPEVVKYHILPNGRFDESVFTEGELHILNRVVNKFKYMKVNEIVEYMHEETAYIETQPDELIPFALAKEIREF